MRTRREILRSGAVAVTAASAGCSFLRGQNNDGEAGPSPEAGVVWDRRYSASRFTRFLDVVPVGTGGFFLVGFTTQSTDRPGEGFVLRTDENGVERWRRTFPEFTAFINATETPDGDLVGATYRARGGGGSGDSGAIRLGRDGTERWRETLSSSGESQLLTATRAPNGGCVLGGYDGDTPWLVYLGEDGSVRQDRRPVHPAAQHGVVSEVVTAPEGVVVLTAVSEGSGEGRGLLFEVALDGTIRWGRRYSDVFSGLVGATDSYALLGRYSRGGSGPDPPPRPMLTTVTDDGSVTGSHTYGPPDDAHWFTEEGLVVTPDGGYLVGGWYEPWEERGRRTGPIVMKTGPDAESVALTRLYGGDDRVWSLARVSEENVFTSTVNDGREARLVRFARPQASNVSLEVDRVELPPDEPLS